MKIAFCLLVLSAVVAVQSAIIDTSARANLNVGSISSGDRQLSRKYLFRAPMPGAVQNAYYTYYGSSNTRISAIKASEYGLTQYANIWIVSGGLNYSNVTLRAQSQRSGGFYYLIDIWGQ